MTGNDLKDVLIRAEPDDVEGKIRENLNDPWSTKCYWTVAGTPQKTGPGRQVFFSDGDEVWGLANITSVDEGAIWFKPIRKLTCLRVNIDAEAPTRGFKYVDREAE